MRKPFIVLSVIAWLLVAAAAWAVFLRPDPSPVAELPRTNDDFAFPVEDFTLIGTDGQPFDTADLRGKTWVAMLFLTKCPTGACPDMVGKIGDLLAAVDDPDVQVVSITVDPAVDSPERLAGYADQIGADDRWHFVTGSPEMIAEAAGKLKMVVAGTTGHDERFLLIDPDGIARGIYDRARPEEMTELRAKVREIQG